MAQETEFGWVILGNTAECGNNTKAISMMTNVEIDSQLKKFWELEELPKTTPYTKEEQLCEEFFQNNFHRQEDERYVVRIPFKENDERLGLSKNRALARFLQVEKRLTQNPDLKNHYLKFMQEYIDLGHMELVKSPSSDAYYLPHHAVFREASTTTKVRVVFDASAKTSSSISLNDIMMTGPTLQAELTSIILRWRKPLYVYTADIEKMFRQINIDPGDRDYQRILWRKSPTEPINEYRLKTVTYGTAAATYLAVRALQQLAKDDQDLYPKAALSIVNDFYVDDLMSGSDTIADGLNKQQKLKEAKKLRKSANSDVTIFDDPHPGEDGLIKEAPTTHVVTAKKLSLTVLLVTLLLTMSTVNSQIELNNNRTLQPYEVNTFSFSPGIYFEDAGKINWINDAWNLVVYYNMNNYHQELNGFRRVLKQLNIFCEQAHKNGIERNTCDIIISQFNHLLGELEHADTLLQATNSVRRNKRSYFDGVGNLMNTMFGVLDSKAADHYEEQIQMAKENDKHLLNLIKNQTLIIEATNNVLKRKDEMIQKQFKVLQTSISSLLTLENDTNSIKSMINFISTSTQCILILMSYQKTQSNLLDMVMDSKHGQMNAYILTPQQLNEQVKVIQSNLPHDLSVAGYEKDDVTQLYKYMHLKTRVTSDNIIFSIQVPLINKEDFQLFRLLPLPTRHKDSHVVILPSSEYLIVNLHRDAYYPLGEYELKECKSHINPNRLLCNQRKPIYKTGSNTSICEMEMLNHNSQISSKCNLKTTKITNMWIQLLNSNNWIYVMGKDETVDVICNQIIFQVSLKNSGIIKLGKDCLVRSKTSIIYSHNIYGTTMSDSFLPTTNLSSEFERRQLENISIPILNIDVDDELAEINKAIQQQKNQEHLPEITNHDVHQYTISYTTLSIVLILCIGFIINRRRMRTTSNNVVATPTFNFAESP